MLARIAGETGGRLTTGSNDLSLGYARAKRDLGCQYTIGVYVRDSTEQAQQIKINILRPGLRARHPERYGGAQGREFATLSAAFHAPQIFNTGFVRSHLFLLQPQTPKRWETLIAVSFPVSFKDHVSRTLDFGAVLHRGSKLAHSFNRRVQLNSVGENAPDERRFLFLEPADLAPGAYELTIVLHEDDNVGRPSAARVRFEVPEVPRGEISLVPPILGQPRQDNIVVRGDGGTTRDRMKRNWSFAEQDIVAGRGSFEPLLVQQADSSSALGARNKACRVGPSKADSSSVSRQIAANDVTTIYLPEVALELERKGKVSCQNIVELLPDGAVAPGDYRFEATVLGHKRNDEVAAALPYAVEQGAAVAPPAMGR